MKACKKYTNPALLIGNKKAFNAEAAIGRPAAVWHIAKLFNLGGLCGRTMRAPTLFRHRSAVRGKGIVRYL